jgi:prepilin-type N-terminal cleavage/methylation domain-containing protein
MKQKNGFTLVELAIVLVVIGLITGGIIAGQELIQASNISSVAAKMQKYQIAYNKYKEKYKATPGDHSSAFDYWGTDCGASAGACNGNGDRRISTAATEPYYFFRHLWLAEFSEDNLTGVSSATPSIGTNLPETAIAGVTLYPYSWRKLDYFIVGEAGAYTSPYLNLLTVGKVTSGQSYISASAFTPAEAKKIDQKIDDGKPGTGIVIAGKAGTLATTGCANNSANTLVAMRSSEYRLSDTDLECTIAMVLEGPV